MPSFLWPQGLQDAKLRWHSPRLAMLHPKNSALLGTMGRLPKSCLLPVTLGDFWSPEGPLGSSYQLVCDFSASLLLVNILLTWLRGSLLSGLVAITVH